eukprot:CAMPEP_0178458546 /NCGR_PEP_ID=MMETSP0689_2-20121128/47602_1 /TAXON_ID=160604 /ORGANISM="Amphidinium massartii, Strain CS-259" /LENGTH=300 /DNA_ID=CAMNT_0020084859 /DNA_START=245 /DNA_END=1144 /DNA_ORIENTATION=+
MAFDGPHAEASAEPSKNAPSLYLLLAGLGMGGHLLLDANRRDNKEMLLNVGLNASLLGKYSFSNLLAQIGEHRRKGVTPVVIGLVWQIQARRKHPWPFWRQDMSQMARKGAYVILYQSEPWLDFLPSIVSLAFGLQALVWEYSRGSTLRYYNPANESRPVNITHDKMNSTVTRGSSKLIIRYLPPGCSKTLDVQADVNASYRDEGHIGFIGRWHERPPETQADYNFSGLVVDAGATWNVRTPEEWRAYLEHLPMQIGTHARWNEGKLFESFRAAQVITGGGCMLSEASSPEDEEDFDGIV